MEDEEEFSCPYCESTIDCEHLVMVTDSRNICGGELFESEEEIKSIIVEAMLSNKNSLPKKLFNNPHHDLREFWEGWIKEEEGTNAKEYYDECYVIYEFIVGIFSDLNLESHLNEFGWIFWAEDSKKAKNDFFKKIQEDLN